MGEEVFIDHVSCGSAHTIAWSSMQRKLACPLPSKVPMEFNHLQPLPMPVLRNRLILLHHFSNLFCKSLTMFMLQSDHIHEMELGYDKLRGIIMSSSKVHFRCFMSFHCSQVVTLCIFTLCETIKL